jgi:hypothetical protein
MKPSRIQPGMMDRSAGQDRWSEPSDGMQTTARGWKFQGSAWREPRPDQDVGRWFDDEEEAR